MKKHLVLISSLLIVFSQGNAQIINQELAPNSTLLQEEVSGRLNPEDVLNGKIKCHNPDPVALVYNDNGFDYSKLGHVPAKGIHPRMFTSPMELENVKDRLLHTQTGQMMLDKAQNQINEMRDGKGKFGKTYQLLLQDEVSPEIAFGAGWKFTNLLTVQGLIAQMNHNKALSAETSAVAAHYLRSMAKYIKQMPTLEGLEDLPKEPLYWGGYLAKLYDFTANEMSQSDRKFFGTFVAEQSAGKYSVGMELPPHWRRWNHVAMSLSYPFSLLSVEKEAPIDSRIYKRGKELAEDYYTYQFSPEGMSTEGMNYTFGQSEYNLAFVIAMARRGDQNLFAHPHMRTMPDWFIHTMSPNPKALWYTGGDTGSISILPWTMVMVMKYFYPEDQRLDYLLANSLPETLTDTPDIIAFICCNDPQKTADTYNGVPPASTSLTYYSPQRGSFITRNQWSQDAVKFSLEGRTDTYFISHDHSDRGNFSLSALGREWVIDGFRSTESKYHSVICIDGRGQGYFATPASWIGFYDKPKVTFGIIDTKYCYDWMWLKSPVTNLMIGKKVADKWKTGVYKTVADNLRLYYPQEKPERDPLENVANYYTGNLKENALIWHEDTWPMRLKNYPVEYAFRTAGLVKGKHTYAIIIDDIKKDNNEHLYEWIMPTPMDIELVSIKQLADVKMKTSTVDLGFNNISGHRRAGEFDVILGDKQMKRDMRPVDDRQGECNATGVFIPSKGDPQLLVRVLDKMPALRPNLEINPTLEAFERLKTENMHQFYLRSGGLGKRLVIPARCTGDPNYKVLLFPYRHGEEMPVTEWNDDRTELTVKWSDQIDYLTFKKGEDGRTRIVLKGDSFSSDSTIDFSYNH